MYTTKRHENIREIFDLTNQFTIQKLTNVMTADRIPLEVEVGIGYRLVREASPEVDGLIENKDQRPVFPVKEETLFKAISNNTTGGRWSGFGGGAPVGQLRDQFMAYTLDELFELNPGNGETPRPDRRRISQIERETLSTLNSFAGNFGVTFTGVDIREFTLPDALLLEIKSGAEARSIRRISEERNRAQQELIDEILATIARYKMEPLDEIDIQLATTFVELGRRTMSDDVLGHEYVEMLEKLAKSDGAKVFTPFPFDFNNGRNNS